MVMALPVVRHSCLFQRDPEEQLGLGVGLPSLKQSGNGAGATSG